MPEPQSPANSQEGRKHQGCPTLQVVTPARRCWVTGPERAGKGLEDLPKHSAHAQRLQELRGWGLMGGRGIGEPWPFRPGPRHRGDARRAKGYSEMSQMTLTTRLGDYHRGFSTEVYPWDCALSILENATGPGARAAKIMVSNHCPPVSSMANFTPVNGSSANQSVRLVTATHNHLETVEMVFIATVTGSLSLVTVVGNILVMLSIKVNRQLQTVNNYFLFSLACADLIIGVFSMNLYTVYIIKGYWPLGAVVCDLWLALDYVVSNASVMNLLIISFDRYFCVTKPLTYPARRTTKMAGLMIAAAWVLSFVLWAPAILFWQFVVGKRTVPDNQCFIQFLSNPAVTFGTAIAAFYLPVIIMTVLYIHISLASRSRVHKHRPEGPKEKKAKTLAFLKSPLMKPSIKKPPPGGASREELRNGKLEEAPPPALPPPPRPVADKDTSNESSSGSATQNTKERPPTELSTTEATTPALPAPTLQPRTLNPASKWSKIQIVTKQTGNECVTAIEIVPATPAGMRPAANVARKFASIARNQVRKKRQMAARERKVTRTIFAILLAFILTWTPYNVMVLVNTFCQSCIPERVWSIGYWLCYVNSTINPACYALCNATFKKTFRHLLLCQYRNIGTAR
ncbi:cholinergic receptor muscarinic 4 [Cricetulus griseus]